MVNTSKPSKKQLRDYLQTRHAAPTPPPTPEQIRRELGWELVPHNPKLRG